MVNVPPHKTKTLHARIVSGSAVLLAGAGLTTAVNLLYNVVVASFLGPANFGHATVVYTLLIMLSAVALAFQIVCAKVVAQQSTEAGKRAVYRVFHRIAWASGVAAALALLAFKNDIASYLNLPDPILVSLLAIGSAFYVPLGCRRGCIQGVYGFRRLAVNLVTEGVVRLAGSYVLIVLNFGVRGVIAVNAAAIAVAYFAVPPGLKGQAPNPLRFWTALFETSQALFLFAGQVLITNCDIVIVKHLFAPKTAGLYAAVALVGRVISTFSSAVVNTMFPLVAGTDDKERKDIKVIGTSLLLVVSIGSVVALGLFVTPARMWTSFLGSGFTIGGTHDLSFLAALYALKTVIYSISVVFITFEMSYKVAHSSAVQLLFSGIIIAGIYQYHSSLLQVIQVQLVLLCVLVVLSAMPFLFSPPSNVKEGREVGACSAMELIRKVSEDEVIAAFLRSDLSDGDLSAFQTTPRELITEPNFDDPSENTKRRALMLIRHLSLWNEIPAGTEWFEVAIKEAGLGRISVFPRAHWRRLAHGKLSIIEIVEAMRKGLEKSEAAFAAKISALTERMSQGNSDLGTVILLGLNENSRVTVLDGNHRLATALLSSPGALSRLRFVCGLSPRMEECCWYKTDIASLSRYAKNLLKAAIRNPKAELVRLLEKPEEPRRSQRPTNGTVTSLVRANDIEL